MLVELIIEFLYALNFLYKTRHSGSIYYIYSSNTQTPTCTKHSKVKDMKLRSHDKVIHIHVDLHSFQRRNATACLHILVEET